MSRKFYYSNDHENLEEKKETHQSLDLIALVPPITLRQCDVYGR